MAHSTNRSIDFAPAWLKLPETNQDSRKQEAAGQHPPVYRHSISHTDHQHYPESHHYSQRNSNSSNQHSRPGARAHNAYRSGPSSSPQHPTQLQRSQSTGSYSEPPPPRPSNSNTATPAATKPLEEEFPLLCSAPSAPGSAHLQRNNHTGSTAQWRIKERARDGNSKSASNNQLNDSLLTSNMTGGKVYRAQVKPVKRTNMIAVGNDTSTANTVSKHGENGEHNDHSALSSSLDKEKKFLQELGWNEDEESDDDSFIPEQDPAKLEQIMMEAKLARQRLLMKSKQSMKSVPSAVLPNEDDLPSSSDNSDNE